MEQHQVPRNITGFKFKLIGDMTLKQFGYLAGGVFSAFIIYKASPYPPIITWILTGTVGFLGFALAFVPIQERSFDSWLVAFIKSIFSPTQFLWQKEGIVPEFLYMQTTGYVKPLTQAQSENQKYAKEKLHQYLSKLPSPAHLNLNTQEKRYVDRTLSLFDTVVSPPILHPEVSTTIKSNIQPEAFKPQAASYIKMNEGITKSSINPNSTSGTILSDQYEKAKYDVNPILSSPQIPHKTVLETTTIASPAKQIPSSIPDVNQSELLKKLSTLSSEKENLAKQLEMLKNELKKTVAPVIKIDQVQTTPKVAAPIIKNIIPDKPQVLNTGVSGFHQAPNIVVGIVKDSEKKLVPNIIITIKDNKGMPLRAIKTNKLGQFETATPLPNGTYLLEIEDPLKRFVFDILQITLSGKIFQPIIVVAKGEKEQMREKLNKELFGAAVI
jgi:hypothetical protein